MTDKSNKNPDIEKINELANEFKGMFDSLLEGMQKIADDPEASAQFIKELEDSFKKAR
jgi:methyl-accepting chemotaxis protein